MYVSKQILHWLAAFMLTFLAAGFGTALYTLIKNPPVLAGESVLTGARASAFEAKFNEQLPFRQTAIDTWGTLQYLAFNEGRAGVLVGADGWLFTSEEFQDYPDNRGAEATLELAGRASDQLAQQGTNFVVVLIPDKARVYPEQLGRYSYPNYNAARYQSFLNALSQRGIEVVDLLTPLLRAKKQAVFLKTDTHWTPYGAQVAAQAVAAKIAARDLLPGFGTSTFVTEEKELISHDGDLLTYLPLGRWQGLGPAPDRLTEQQTRPRDAGGGLFGEQTIPVTLVGTSYSANPLWNFAGALKEALGADLLNLADEGLGPVAPLEAYLAEPADAPPDLLIWEIPERFLWVDYSE